MTLSIPIGTILIYNGRAYRFCGITPASIEPTMASLEDPRTGARTDVPMFQLDGSTQSPQRNGNSLGRVLNAGSPNCGS